ncbi:MAG: hypothetical protein IIZ12_03590 [Eggerthellaceae bacterium]|nr:hypothetical protein [Eggerthellaceae bacterium]
MTSATEKFNVEIPDGCEFKFDPKLTLTSLEAPEMKFDKYRETRFEYSERLGEASKSISIETYLTNDELIKLCHELMEVTR